MTELPFNQMKPCKTLAWVRGYDLSKPIRTAFIVLFRGGLEKSLASGKLRIYPIQFLSFKWVFQEHNF